MKKDVVSKETIKTIAQDISKYILNIDVKDIEFIDKELQRVEKREADIVARCKLENKASLLHIEIQNGNDKIMPNRMLRYYTDIKLLYPNLPIYQYLIYIGKPKLSMRDKIEEDNINYKYNIIDMHQIDCQKFLKMDNPDALVLSILCDFKGRDEIEIITYIIKRLEKLTQKDEHKLGKYMLILETLSTNRDLKEKIKEAEEMLRDIKYEDLPSYEIGYNNAIIREKDSWVSQGLSKGIFETAIKMIDKFNLSIDEVIKELNIKKEELLEYMKNRKN